MAEFNLWLLIVGIAAGAAVMWLVIGTLARNDDETDAEERQLEAGWIADTIEQHGGRAPVTLIEQILALHRRYLQGGPGVPIPQGEPDDAEAEAAPMADAEMDAEAPKAAEVPEAAAVSEAAEVSEATAPPAGAVNPAAARGGEAVDGPVADTPDTSDRPRPRGSRARPPSETTEATAR
jgi:hypothetical protein